ncbi:DegV family protein [Sedimentibacter sp. zth1]|uniref:DegV family protein n=1 Tax=Sedimentibacter sp. zth1 TaxID=2816908 RepID=UPI001A9132DF|nr:DegV family protein [Sedimentibacter sp. zth1]QSX05300.1 DegV family protein [Sedimentibacter sp. zth1]
MNSKIIVDSCLDYDDNIAWLNEIERIPFKLIVDEEEIIDDNIDTDMLLDKMKQKKTVVKSACPSPNDFYNSFEDNGESYVVTISSKLSGSHNSAELAKKMFLEKSPNSKIHIFDSKSAASGQALIALQIKTLIEEKLNFEQIIENIEKYIEKLNTLFILNTLDNLAKNGRISMVKAKLASILHIVPILCGNEVGEIDLKDQIRGNKKAFMKLVEFIGESCNDYKDRVLGITHVNALEKAKKLKDDILSKYNFKDVLILEAGGLSTLYADDGGIIVTF